MITNHNLKRNMGYIDKFLLKDENIIYSTRLHWIVIVKPIIWIIISAVILSNYQLRRFLYDLLNDTNIDFGQIDFILTLIGILMVLSFVLNLIFTLIKYFTTEFGITTKRVIVKYGFIKRNSFEILLKKIEGVQVNQSFWGRILDYGTIVITGTGSSRNFFTKIVSPFTLRRVCQEQVEEN